MVIQEKDDTVDMTDVSGVVVYLAARGQSPSCPMLVVYLSLKLSISVAVIDRLVRECCEPRKTSRPLAPNRWRVSGDAITSDILTSR